MTHLSIMLKVSISSVEKTRRVCLGFGIHNYELVDVKYAGLLAEVAHTIRRATIGAISMPHEHQDHRSSLVARIFCCAFLQQWRKMRLNRSRCAV
jgi:hypothetical protein